MAKKPTAKKPTVDQFTKYQAAYDYFNRKLFGGELAPCILVFRDGRKTSRGMVMGHFGPHRWAKAGKAKKADKPLHEISLNPDTLSLPLIDTFATLVHEMAHQWQQDHGTPPCRAYHDKQWAAKMIEVGLIPSATGKPEGKQTGRNMDHYVQPGGPFERAFTAMPPSIGLPWVTALAPLAASPEKEKEAAKKNKIKYTCPECETNVWGKPDLAIVCGECRSDFEPVESEEEN